MFWFVLGDIIIIFCLNSLVYLRFSGGVDEEIMLIWLIFFIMACFLIMVGSYLALICFMGYFDFDDKENKKWTKK